MGSLQEQMLAGGGEVGERMRAMDWSQTSVGPLETWPPLLRSSVSLLLASPNPLCFYWGPDLAFFYNDDLIPFVGAKHPRILGLEGPRAFPEAWDVLWPLLDGVLRNGTSVRVQDQPLFLDRAGFDEEGYYSFSYTPLRDETGKVVGVLSIVTDDTPKCSPDGG